MSKKPMRLLMIHTGGTLVMQSAEDGAALSPVRSEVLMRDLLAELPVLKQIADIEMRPLFRLDSADMQPEHWVELARAIHDSITDYDGFVVIHGTDTMAYTASALSFLLPGLDRPVVLTGAQKPLTAIRTDARAKLTAGGRGEALLEELLAEQQRRVETQKRELAKQLAEACGRRELELLVVRREEPVELRIPPFAVELDRAKGRATLQFARLPVAVCEAEAEPIAALVARWRDTWMRDFQPARFFDACRGASAAARATGLGGQSERVEILEFMPFIALQLQPAKFRQEPSAKNFVDYSRAHFAFDLMQLRRAGLLNHEGWRLNLGVATGTTASNKKRALFVEDERGQGEYKLTVYFTRA